MWVTFHCKTNTVSHAAVRARKLLAELHTARNRLVANTLFVVSQTPSWRNNAASLEP